MVKEEIGERCCFLHEDRGADVILIQAVDGHDRDGLEEELRELCARTEGRRFSLCAFLVENWNKELSPWRAAAVFGNEPFGEGAGETLAYITETLLPKLRARHGNGAEIGAILGGYFLSGLFALRAACQTDVFCGIVAASPSVWFPGWEAYSRENAIRSRVVYLSLGDREERARNPVMARVGENIRLTAEILRKSPVCERSILEWNPGNHFQDAALRKNVLQIPVWYI